MALKEDNKMKLSVSIMFLKVGYFLCNGFLSTCNIMEVTKFKMMSSCHINITTEPLEYRKSIRFLVMTEGLSFFQNQYVYRKILTQYRLQWQLHKVSSSGSWQPIATSVKQLAPMAVVLNSYQIPFPSTNSCTVSHCCLVVSGGCNYQVLRSRSRIVYFIYFGFGGIQHLSN